MKIGIAGTGMFGFALAFYLGKKYEKDKDINIITFDSNNALIQHLNKYRTHLYHFKNKKISPQVIFTTDKKELVENTDIVIMAVTSQSIREVIRELKDYLKNQVIILNTAKALERENAKTFYEVIEEELSTINICYKIAKLSGGTFAEDIINEAPLGADIACTDSISLNKLQKIFSSHHLYIYGNTDLIGVEYAGAFKNVIAIMAGIINGLGLPYGSETHMISRAAQEAKNIAVNFGARPQTFSMESQCWGNDLWMSCTGKSRNREYGILIGKGFDPKEALDKLQEEHKLVEGYYTAQSIPALFKKANVKTPIFNEIYQIIQNHKIPLESIKYLMNLNLENIDEI